MKRKALEFCMRYEELSCVQSKKPLVSLGTPNKRQNWAIVSICCPRERGRGSGWGGVGGVRTPWADRDRVLDLSTFCVTRKGFSESCRFCCKRDHEHSPSPGCVSSRSEERQGDRRCKCPTSVSHLNLTVVISIQTHCSDDCIKWWFHRAGFFIWVSVITIELHITPEGPSPFRSLLTSRSAWIFQWKHHSQWHVNHQHITVLPFRSVQPAALTFCFNLALLALSPH